MTPKLPQSLMFCILALAFAGFSSRAYGDFLGTKGFSLRQGSPRVETFEVTGASQAFTLYFTADYACQAVVAAESQMASFQSGGGISSVYDSFDGNFGIHSFTLPPGRYFLGVRSTSASDITCSYELEKFPVEPEADFVQTVKKDVQTLSPGTRLIQPFTVSAGSYYVIDGNNTGLEYYLITASEFDHFRNNQAFSYIPDYSGTVNSSDCNMPGLFTMKDLPPGEYGLAFRNTSDKSAALTYGLYQYAAGGDGGSGGGGSITIAGAGSWAVSGTTIDISAAKISNTSVGGVSGTLRLQLWATTSPYTGGSMSGHIVGTRSLGTLAGGTSFNNVSGAVPYKSPPAGTYYITLTLEEYDSGSYSIIDHLSFDATTTFGGGGGVNAIPVATGSRVTTAKNTTVTVLLSGSDPESHQLTYSIVTPPAKGTLTGTAPNLSYKPNPNVTGSDSFTFRVNDGNSYSAVATVSITVTAALPLSWVSGEIGTGQRVGSAFYNAGIFTQAGSGTLGTTNDKLRFTYQTLSGDGIIVAKVSALQNTGTASRVGVMIRDTLAANSKQVFIGLSGSGSYCWVRRTSTGGSTATTSSGTGSVPNTWLGLVRSGSKITAYKSSNGSTWTAVGSTTVTMAKNCYIGLAVASGSAATLNTSQFSNVKVTP